MRRKHIKIVFRNGHYFFLPQKKIKRKYPPINIIYTDNYKGKARTIQSISLIEINREYAQRANKITLLFIILHEIGHRYYYTELLCDIFAINIMLNFYSPDEICTNIDMNNKNRKRILINYLNKIIKNGKSKITY